MYSCYTNCTKSILSCTLYRCTKCSGQLCCVDNLLEFANRPYNRKRFARDYDSRVQFEHATANINDIALYTIDLLITSASPSRGPSTTTGIIRSSRTRVETRVAEHV